ncbi:MAG TPA: kelch repeat-containing protein, partial [Archangium sp.]
VRLDSGKVLVAGGNQPAGRYGPLGPPGEVYDPETGTWSEVQGSFTSRSRTAATVLYSGKVLVTGGYRYWPPGSEFASAEVNIYDPATNSWSYARNLIRARHGHSAIRLYSGNVLVVGGIDGGNTVELYDPYTNQWSLGPPLPFNSTPFFSATMLYSGEVLVTDGIGQAALYDPSTNTWNTTPYMKVGGRSEPSATLLHTGEVLFVGGNSSFPQYVERFTR